MIKVKKLDLFRINNFLLFLILLLFQFSTTQSIGILLIIILSALNSIYAVKNNYKINKLHILLVLIIIFSVFYMIRVPYVYTTEAQIEIFWLLFGILLSATMIISKFKIRSALLIIIMTGVIGGFITIVSYFTSFYFGGLVSAPYAGTRAVGGFDGPNELATYHLLIISICLGIIVRNKYNISYVLLLISTFISLITIFLTYSRGGLVGLAILIIIFYLLFVGKKFIKSLFYLFPITLGLIVIYLKYGNALITQFDNVRKNRSERSYLTEEVFELFSQKPIFGWGLGSFSEIASVRNAVPHNDFYVFLISGGLISFMLFISFLSWLLIKSYKEKNYPIIFFIIIFITQAMTFNHLIRGRISILFWIVISLLFIVNSYKKHEGEYNE